MGLEERRAGFWRVFRGGGGSGGGEEPKPCLLPIDRSAELTDFLLHYVNSSPAGDPLPLPISECNFFIYLSLVSQETSLPLQPAAVQMQQLLPVTGAGLKWLRSWKKSCTVSV